MADIWWRRVSKEPAFGESIETPESECDLVVIGGGLCGLFLSQNLGRAFGEFFVRTRNENDLSLPVTSPDLIPFQGLKSWLGGLAFPAYQAQDHLKLS